MSSLGRKQMKDLAAPKQKCSMYHRQGTDSLLFVPERKIELW